MANHKRLSVSLKRDAAIAATRVAIGKERLVYVLVADKKLQYPKARSRIAYIGTTEKGVSRIAGSVATRSEAILRLHGVRSFVARVITCRPRQKVKSWRKLERALLIRFRETYGAPPRCNVQGKRMKWVDEDEYFRISRLNTILEELA